MIAGRRRRNSPGNAQAEGLFTLISSGERSNCGPPKGYVARRPLISQVQMDRGATDREVCRPFSWFGARLLNLDERHVHLAFDRFSRTSSWEQR